MSAAFETSTEGAGALRDSDYTAKLAAAGFENIAIEPTRIDAVGDARQLLAGSGHKLPYLTKTSPATPLD